MTPRDLIESARLLLNSRKGRPNSACLRRATSAAYYAMFHHLAFEAANLLIGISRDSRSDEAWRQVYRSLDHKPAKTKCENKGMLRKFPAPIADFATLFATMQIKRHSADYDPAARLAKSIVINDILLVEQALIDFATAPARDRRAFCAYILLKER